MNNATDGHSNDTEQDLSDDQLPLQFAAELKHRHRGNVAAILLYGSWLRGKRDTLLDFYVLLERYSGEGHRALSLANRLLPPNVFHLSLELEGRRHAAKYATLTLDHFERAIAHDFHSYFWARFAQPVSIIFANSAISAQRIDRACALAAERMVAETTPLLSQRFSTSELWVRALSLTYACELRSEEPARTEALVAANKDHFDALTAQLAPNYLSNDGSGYWSRPVTSERTARYQKRWRYRRVLGKVLSVARLFKAAFTFNEALDYVLWKVERHSGIKESASPLQHRYPLLFAWPVLWRIYRRGGFR